MEPEPLTEKILLVISCSKSKLGYPAPAKTFYTGQLFRSLVKLARQNQWDVLILSGKFGLIPLTKQIEPYDQKIETEQDISRIRKQALPLLREKVPHYDKILVLMGKTYRKVIKPAVNHKYIVIHHRKGIFGYNKLIYRCSRLPIQKVIPELEKYDGYYSHEHNTINDKPNENATLEPFIKNPKNPKNSDNPNNKQ
jgi:hypothetical protein